MLPVRCLRYFAPDISKVVADFATVIAEERFILRTITDSTSSSGLSLIVSGAANLANLDNILMFGYSYRGFLNGFMVLDFVKFGNENDPFSVVLNCVGNEYDPFSVLLNCVCNEYDLFSALLNCDDNKYDPFSN